MKALFFVATILAFASIGQAGTRAYVCTLSGATINLTVTGSDQDAVLDAVFYGNVATGTFKYYADGATVGNPLFTNYDILQGKVTQNGQTIDGMVLLGKNLVHEPAASQGTFMTFGGESWNTFTCNLAPK